MFGGQLGQKEDRGSKHGAIVCGKVRKVEKTGKEIIGGSEGKEKSWGHVSRKDRSLWGIRKKEFQRSSKRGVERIRFRKGIPQRKLEKKTKGLSSKKRVEGLWGGEKSVAFVKICEEPKNQITRDRVGLLLLSPLKEVYMGRPRQSFRTGRLGVKGKSLEERKEGNLHSRK